MINIEAAIKKWMAVAEKYQHDGALDTEPLWKFQRFKSNLLNRLMADKIIMVPTDWDLYAGAKEANWQLTLAANDLVQAVKETKLADLAKVKDLLEA